MNRRKVGVGLRRGEEGLKSPEALAHMALQPDLYFISMAARLLDMHPQTLRKYERLGLVRPARTIGSMRLYSHDEIDRLRFIKRLVDESGVNLAGVQQLLSVAEAMQRIRPLMQPAALQRDATRRRLIREMDQLAVLLGLDHGDEV